MSEMVWATFSARHLLGAACTTSPVRHFRMPSLLRTHHHKFTPRATCSSSPAKKLQVASLRSFHACPLVPGAALTARPAKKLKVATLSSRLAGRGAPERPRSTQPTQDVEVATTSSHLEKFILIPGAPVLLQKLQELEVPAFRGVDCCGLVPRDALLPEELENIPVTTHSRCFRHHVHCTPLVLKRDSYSRKVASLCCQHGCLFIPGAAFLHCVRHHLLVPALRCVVDCAHVPRATLGAKPL
mmetsp:Transcript_13769/g.24374  ORF Transcript_13769/g.24374 Transcript_13769/m.24374 type:complete len:242 (+) Transcript_13769:226-951(+)